MRNSSLAVSAARSVALCGALCGLLGCGSSGSGANSGPATTIVVTSQVAPALVAVRDGIAADWQPATQTSPLTQTALVHGPYVVAFVCAGVPQPLGSSATLMTQIAQTPADSPQIAGCTTPLTEHQVTGQMVQVGRAQLGDSADASTNPNWSFQIPIPDGTYDLLATTADQIATQRGVVIHGDTALATPIDVAATGTAFTPAAFTAPNAMPGETVRVLIGLLTTTTTQVPAQIYFGVPETAKLAPDSVMIAGDVQTASVRASNGSAFRALRRPIRVGGDTAYTLPAPVTGVAWSDAGGQLSVSWTSLPPLEHLLIEADSDVAPLGEHIDLSANFMAATHVNDVLLDSDLPGFQAAWRIDFKNGYFRSLTAQQGTESTTLVSSMDSEDTQVAMPLTEPAARRDSHAMSPRTATP